MTLRSPEGSGIKGGKVEYHVRRMLAGLAFLTPEYAALFGEGGMAFTEKLTVYHARLAARAALNGIYNGRRPV